MKNKFLKSNRNTTILCVIVCGIVVSLFYAYHAVRRNLSDNRYVDNARLFEKYVEAWDVFNEKRESVREEAKINLQRVGVGNIYHIDGGYIFIVETLPFSKTTLGVLYCKDGNFDAFMPKVNRKYQNPRFYDRHWCLVDFE